MIRLDEEQGRYEATIGEMKVLGRRRRSHAGVWDYVFQIVYQVSRGFEIFKYPTFEFCNHHGLLFHCTDKCRCCDAY